MDKEQAIEIHAKLEEYINEAVDYHKDIKLPDVIDLECLKDNPSPGDVIKIMDQIQDALAEAKNLKTNLQKAFDLLRQDYVPEYIDGLGISLVSNKAFRLEVRPQMHINVPAANREALHKWLRKHKLKHLITETVNAPTLKAWVKDAMENQLKYPGELLKIEPYRQAVLVKR